MLAALESLGAGFQLATHDLDIRGAGNLLGDEQSGHIREVGFELYQSMLEEAILEAKAGGLEPRARAILAADHGRRADPDPGPLCPRPRPPHGPLPPPQRARIGRGDRSLRRRDDRPLRHAAARDREPAQDHRDQDELPRRLGRQDRRRRKGALVSFHNDSFPDLPGLLAYVERLKGTARLRPDSKLVITRAWGDADARLNGALQLSKGLARIVG